MPRFTLDLQWTEQGLEHFRREEHLKIREVAKAFATDPAHPLNIISITDRLVPTPLGPIWVVEGEDNNVSKVVEHFRQMGNVTVTVQMS